MAGREDEDGDEAKVVLGRSGLGPESDSLYDLDTQPSGEHGVLRDSPPPPGRLSDPPDDDSPFPYSADLPPMVPLDASPGPRDRRPTRLDAWDQPSSDFDGAATLAETPAVRPFHRDLAPEQRWWTDFAGAFDGILWIATPAAERMVYLSPAFEHVFERPLPEVTRGKGSWLHWIHEDDRPRVAEQLRRLVGGGRVDTEYRILLPDGTFRWLHDRAFPIWGPTGHIELLGGLAEDITHRKVQSRKRIQRREQLLRRVLDLVPHQIFAIDRDGRFLLANEATATSLGTTVRDLTGARIADLIDDAARLEMVERDLITVIEGGVELRGLEDHYVDARGVQRTLATSKVPLELTGADTRALLGIAVDISEQRAAEAALRRRAFYDLLTGLPNRDLFVERLEHALARSERRDADGFAVLFMDVDHFKEVNDTLGHLVGDDLLVEVARRFRTCVRPGDTVARFGGDEFAMLLEGIDGENGARVVAARIHEAMREPFELAGEKHFLSTSVGIALGDGVARPAMDLLRDADGAMYHAKNRGPGRTQVFSSQIRAVAQRQVRLKNELREGLDRGEFFLQYQPIVDLTDGSLAGLEALCRWRHPSRGVVPPGEFIAIAERSGLMPDLERFIIREAFTRLRDWSARFELAPFRLSINVSSGQLAEASFVPKLELTLREFAVDPNLLVIEVTESSLIENAASTRATLKRLRALGIKVALDDFGTGFSSLSHLHSFPIDILKVDRSFTSHLEKGDTRARIVQATLSLGKDLGLVTTAEGVETEAQRAWLSAAGCNFGQGWLFDKAVEAEVVDVMLAERRRWPTG